MNYARVKRYAEKNIANTSIPMTMCKGMTGSTPGEILRTSVAAARTCGRKKSETKELRIAGVTLRYWRGEFEKTQWLENIATHDLQMSCKGINIVSGPEEVFNN